MILQTKEFKELASSIIAAVESNVTAKLTETLELVTVGKTLFLNVTNGEYYDSHIFTLDHEEEFKVTVDANTFLKLIDKTTTETIELSTDGKILYFTGNGKYKLPLVLNGESLLELPVISIQNKTLEMNVPYSILDSIATYNSRTIAKSSLAVETQKLYYLDQQGCLTYTDNEGCVNRFTLEKPIQLLLNDRIVKLFKLFKNSSMVKFELGYDPISENIVQTKICLSTANIKSTAIVQSSDALLKKIPVTVIRNRADKEYDNKIILNKNDLLALLNRLALFTDPIKNVKPYSTFKFDTLGNLTIYDVNNDNFEEIGYQKGSSLTGEYIMKLDLVNFTKVIEACSEEYLTLNFGDGKACAVTRGPITTVVAEVRSKQTTTQTQQ